MAFDPLNVGEDYSMIDDNGFINPDIERPPVVGFRAHAERIIRRWLSALGYVWYSRDYGGGLLELINSPCTTAQLTSKAQELRQQAMAEPGTTKARVSLRKVGESVLIDSAFDAQGFSVSVQVNLNSSAIAVTILGV
jgi:phage baseplate assembly protein W